MLLQQIQVLVEVNVLNIFELERKVQYNMNICEMVVQLAVQREMQVVYQLVLVLIQVVNNCNLMV
jgi:hypothetical protein